MVPEMSLTVLDVLQELTSSQIATLSGLEPRSQLEIDFPNCDTMLICLQFF